MTDWNARSDAEWCKVMHGITDGHRPMTPGSDKDVYDLAYWEGVWMRDTLMYFEPTPDDVVLDLGCGNGRFAITCLPYECQYIGMDPVRGAVDFCAKAFKPWSDRYRFEFIDVHHERYNPNGAIRPSEFRIPLDDESVTWAVAISVFTHFTTLDVVENYAREMLRVLRPGGIMWTTWFKSPPNELTRAVERVVYPEAYIRQLFSGQRWLYDHDGNTLAQHDQWRVWVRK